MKALLSAALLLLGAACATAVRAPAPLDPVGRYEFQTTLQGQPLPGSVEVTGGPGSYAGYVRAAGIPDLPIQSVEVEGREMRVTATTPDGPITLRMTFASDDEFVGGWELAGQTGELAGRRLP